MKISSMNSVFKKTLLCSAVLCLTVACSDDSEVNEPQGFELNIISTNDVHGYGLTPTDEAIGFSRMVGYANSLKEQGKNVLMLDAGDMIAGNAETNLDKGANAIEALNVVQYDAMTMGNHATDFGPERFLELQMKMNFPYVVANLFYSDDDEDITNNEAVFEPYLIKTINDVNVAIVGLVTPEYGAAEFYYADPVVTMNRLMPELRAQADVIIVIAHLGNDDKNDDESKNDITSKFVAENVEGIDVIIDGHDHVATPEGRLVNDTLVVNAGDNFSNIAYTTLTIVDDKVTAKSAELIDLTNETLKNSDDEAVSAVLDDIKVYTDSILKIFLAESPVRLEGDRDIVRRGDTNLGRLIADAYKEDTGAELAFMNSGWIRGSANAGNIYSGDVLNILALTEITGNVVTINMTGADVVAALEASYSKDYIDAENRFEQNSGLMQVSGLTADVDTTKDAFVLDKNTGEVVVAGERVSNVFVGEQALVADQIYSVALVFMQNQMAVALGLPMFAGDVESEHSMSDKALTEYLKTEPDAFTLIENPRMNIIK
ncbi:MAG: bifunctional UDP-sugar hydrolase/5'-nucleotidase [Psychromonas sp.]